MRIALMGAGNIARSMAATVRGMAKQGENVELYAVGSRDPEKAIAFAKTEGVQKAFGSYDEMLADGKVDLVYVATPHSHHAEHMKMCISAGKAILCEKAFTGNARQAEEVLSLAESKGVPVAEAIWTRYQPCVRLIREALAAGEIGEVRYMTAALGYKIDHVQRITDPKLAGGALLDLGVYPINFAAMFADSPVKSVSGTAQFFPTGVDMQDSICLTFENGIMATLGATAAGVTDQQGCIAGSDGYITVEYINNPQAVRIWDGNRRLKREIVLPGKITGYEYEVRACMDMLDSGRLEPEAMPHSETIRIMKIMDELRRQWGVRYDWD